MPRSEVYGHVIVNQLPEIISWLVELGLPATNSRYARYHEIIKRFRLDRPDTLPDEGNQRFRDLTLAYRECIDIYIVYRCFREIRHQNFICKLGQVVAGRDVPELGEAGASRNYLFELLVAARLQLAGYAIDFDEKTDVVARRDGITVRLECKRIASEKQLTKRIDQAANQLAQVPKKFGDKVVGLICVDVSSCIVSSARREVDFLSDASREVNEGLSYFIFLNDAAIEAVNTKHMNASYATCFFATLAIWTRLEYGMQIVSSLVVQASGDLSDESFEKLNKVFKGVDHCFSTLFGPEGS